MSDSIPSYEEAFAPYWHPVAFSEEVQEKPVAAKLLGRDLVVWRTASGVQVTDRYCAHRGADLECGKVVGEGLQCAFHGFKYGPDGKCVLIPSQPNTPIPAKAKIQSYATQERFGLVWTCLTGEARLPLPDWARLVEDPELAVVRLPRFEWNISAGRWIENLVDLVHLSWVHKDTFGNPDRQEVPPYDVQIAPNGLHAEMSYPAVSSAHRGPSPKIDMTLLKYDVSWPFAGRLEMKPTLFFAHNLHLAACPVSENKMVGFYFASYKKKLTMFPNLFLKQEPVIVQEDREALERQKSTALPIDFDSEVHVRADKLGIEYRRGLARIRTGKNLDPGELG